MTEDLGDGDQIGPGADELGGHGVAEDVRTEGLLPLFGVVEVGDLAEGGDDRAGGAVGQPGAATVFSCAG